MTLKKYREKRVLSETPEPKGRISKSSGLKFVVQKHDARRLHYDFRLEVHGVLKSWAIPKGPSMNPQDKRLAIEVEDHPLEYGNFEGIIPPGNYGAGTVEIWDKGTYEVAGCNTPQECESALTKGYEKGDMKFFLQGHKLKGEFALVRISKEDNKPQWLLIKKKDAFVQKATGPEALPHAIKPMQPTLCNEPFDDTDWIFEILWNGQRTITEISEQNLVFPAAAEFPDLAEDLNHLRQYQLIIDGEIVFLNREGKPEKDPLNHSLRYMVYDLLYFQGEDLRHLPLMERKKKLKKCLESVPLRYVQYCDHVDAKGIPFYNLVKNQGMPGMLAKKKDSPYISKRSKEWLKIK